MTTQDNLTIDNLSRIIRGVGSYLVSASDEARELYREGQRLLLAIPGHAEYYRDRILKAREDYENPDPKVGPILGRLLEEQAYGFQTLAQLPSVETVRVLGEFLADDRGKIGGPGPPPRMDGKRSMESANCTGALHALHTLPLVQKPVAGKNVYDETDLETYRLWYAQIMKSEKHGADKQQSHPLNSFYWEETDECSLEALAS